VKVWKDDCEKKFWFWMKNVEACLTRILISPQTWFLFEWSIFEMM